jgi:hypothetical protein
MSKTRLSSSEIQDLINKYQSELKKLEFQTEEIIATINQLKEWLESVEQSENDALSRLGKKRKIAGVGKSVQLNVKKQRGRPPKNKKSSTGKSISSAQIKAANRKTRKGYKLSEWDQFVIDAITQKGKPQITQEIVDFAKLKAQEKGLNSGGEEVRKKVVRSLQKLVNRRGDLIKVHYKGKGHAYAIPGMAGIKKTIARKPKKK